MIGFRANETIPFRSDRNDNAVSCLCLLDLANHFLVQSVMDSNRNYRHSLINQGNRPVFHFACRVAFGVDVTYFLEFQSAFQRNWIVDTASEVQEILILDKLRRQRFYCRGLIEHLAYQVSQFRQMLRVESAFSLRYGSA